MSEAYLAVKVVMMPADLNPQGTIFGGVILSYIDQAGAIGAYREVVQAGGQPPTLVTVAMNRVEFKEPVLVGDVVCFRSRLVRLGRTSITVQVTGNQGKLEDFLRVVEPFGVRELVQSGMVAIGRGGRSITDRTLKPVPVPQQLAAARSGSRPA